MSLYYIHLLYMQQYKVWLLNAKNRVEKVIVFNGNYEENMDIFSEDERKQIPKEEEIVFSPVLIHKDDSISQIKKKIINELGELSYDELYLFAYKTRVINMMTALTSSTKSIIYKKIFAQFTRNMDLDEYALDKEIYEHKYLSSLGFNEEKQLSIKTGLGVEFLNKYNYLFSPNPFLNDPTVENEEIQKNIHLNENKQLGDIDDNNIYVCLAKDVFEHAFSGQSEIYSNIYFPNLASNHIFNLQDLEDAQEDLKTKTSSMMNEEEFNSYKILDTLYEVYEDTENALINEKHGINSFNIEITPSYKVVMPLDAIFKNIHADAAFPFIKYNPGVRRENIYRLYSTSLSKTGKKIPYLPKKKIDSLMRTTSNHKQISIYNFTHRLIISIESDGSVKINGEFKEDDVKSIEQIEEIIKSSVNPLIEKINRYLINSGYRISVISTLKDEKIKIANMNYQYSTTLAKKFIEIKPNNNAFIVNNHEYKVKEGIYNVESFVEELKKQMEPNGFDISYDERSEHITITHRNTDFIINVKQSVVKKNSIKNVMGFGENDVLESNQLSLKMPNPVLKIANINLKNTCIYPVFWVEKSNIKKEAVLRFIRVDNFQKMNSLNMFIHDMFNKREKDEDAYNALVTQLGFELNEAKKIVFKVLSSSNVSKNPGLFTTMKLDGDVFKANVGNLTNINYVETLGKYLNSIVKITQEMVDVSICGRQQATIEEEEEEVRDVRKEVEQLLSKPVEQKRRDEDSDEDSDIGFHDSDYESESNGGGGSSGGGGSDSDSDDETVKGKKYFLNRLTKKDPVLFKEVNKKNGKIGRYTRTCPSMQQPVVVSDAEKKNIDKHYKDSYDESIEYGSSDNNKNWYICPRFWCFKTNAPMTQEDIDAGKCGDVKDQKQNVFEFTDKKHKNPDGSYRNFNPGFIVNHHSNKDLCLPCCYAEWDSKMHKDRRDKCLKKGDNEVKSIEKKKPTQTTEIMGYNTTLTSGRWGYLPVSVRRFMQIKYKEQDAFQFLRYGVQKSDKQSLVACLADIYGKIHKKMTTPTVSEMRKIMVESISLDDYKKYGKGSFVRLFSKNPKSKTLVLSESFDNFCKYLLDENSNIDHTYLWDIISTPNKKLFENGLNLVIMEIVNNDITDKVDIICPLSSYVQNRFIKDRDTVFLINQGTKYEPVYFVEKTTKNKHAKAYFSLNTTKKIPNIHNLLILLDNTLNKHCESTHTNVNKYTFKSPMEVGKLIQEIHETKGYFVEKQVLNYQDRTIALLVKTPSNNHVVIPCEPSEQQDYPSEYMDEQSLWSNYKNTLEELTQLKKENDKILCKPVVKMTEDGLVVGFLTETNQFVKIVNKPGDQDDDDDHLKKQIIKENPHEIEMAIDNSTTEDPDRLRIVRNITLESSFFTLYRATIKSLLEDREQRQLVVSIIENLDFSYKEKLEKVKNTIDAISQDVVIYSSFSQSVLNKLSNVSYTCKKNETSGLYINGCTLSVPEKNLISKKNNSLIYPYRVADEIVRYGRIQNYILNSNQFLNTGNTDFKINSDEFIISESLLSKDYFDDMINQNTNEYRSFNETNGIPYDMAKTKLFLPVIVEKAEKEITVNESDNCQSAVEKYYLSTNATNYWTGKVFPEKHLTHKIVFKNNNICSFEPLIHIMKQITKKTYTVDEIKSMLWDAYSDYVSNADYKRKIIYLLKIHGKEKILKKYENDLNLMIVSADYFLTSLDVWVFAQKYKVPIILFSSKNMINDFLIIQDEKTNVETEKDYYMDKRALNKNPKYKYSWIVLGYDKGVEEDKFFFYLSSSSKTTLKNRDANNEMIIKTPNEQPVILESFHKSQLGEFQQQLDYVFEQNKVFSFEDYLEKLTSR